MGCDRLYGGPDATSVERLRARRPQLVASTLVAAERILRHDFDLLGSGPFTPVDPDRAPIGWYTPIDWYLDPVRQLRFPRGVHHKDWKLYEMRPGNADVKYPWELARCQHWVTLGQAFRLTSDERFARELAAELDDFMQANPIGVGINYTCTMDVGLRAVSWALGFELVRASRELDRAFWIRAFSALFDHAVFIRNNLENTYEVTSNHFLSNVVGLWFLGRVFDDLDEGRAWSAFARSALEQEIHVQVLPDGADFESAVPYHRLVTELFLGCARLADVMNKPLSSHYRSRVRDMVRYLEGVLRPDGLMPQVGDADDGRLHVFSGYGSTTPQDARHLFGPAGDVFEEPAWRDLGGEVAEWEAAWWGLGQPTVDGRQSAAKQSAVGSRQSTVSRLFPEAGLAVMRSGRDYLLATNGIVGTKGFGNHKHNDQLSFEYHRDGVPLIVDPGSFVYTCDPDARNLFRSTAYHNTLCIDGVEQNEMRPEWLFRLFETSHAEHVRFDDRLGEAEYVGRHRGYERLADPVTHERTFRLLKPSGDLVIVDTLQGRGEHDCVWHFHTAPGIEVRSIGPGLLAFAGYDKVCRLRFPSELESSTVDEAYSPSYGVRVPCRAINLSTHVTLDGSRTWEFRFET